MGRTIDWGWGEHGWDTGNSKEVWRNDSTQKAKDALGERKQELVERAGGPASTREESTRLDSDSLAVRRAKRARGGDWILVLDADERVSLRLSQEIKYILNHHKIMHVHNFVMKKNEGTTVVAYRIPYQNYVFGSPVYYGGEKYAKVRLFRKGFAKISAEALHEEVILSQELPKARPSQRLRPGLQDGNVGALKGVIQHHSYRTPIQLIKKFTLYAWMAAARQTCQPRMTAAGVILIRQKPGFQNAKPDFESDPVKKLFLYGPHMVWARFIKEKGYKDGWRGLALALAFGYMEGLTYWLQLFRNFTR